MWEAKHISANEKSLLREAHEALEEDLKQFRNTISVKNISVLQQQVKNLEQENFVLKRENQTVEKQVNEMIEKINKILEKLPDEIAAQFVQEWKTIDVSRNKDFQR